jgi:hypothetical protein
MSDVGYKAFLDDSQVLAALRNIDKNMDRLAGVGEKAFGRIGKESKVSGLQIGLVSGLTQQLVQDFIRLGEQAARAFVQIAAGGVQLNRELEVTRIALTNIFEGNERAADAFIGRVDELASRLRVDFQDLRTLAKGILPDIGDAQKTLKVLEQFVILGRDAGQNFTSIRIALEEAATGQFTSLQRRLNIPAESIRRIKALSEEIGIADALIEVLGARIEKAGLNLEDFAGTFEAQIGAIRAEGRQLQRVFGAPIFEELKEQAQAFLDVLDERGPEIERVAVAFGQLAAHIIELIGTNLNEFLTELDFRELEKTADALSDMADAADLLFSQLQGDVNEDLRETRSIIEAIRDALVTAAQAAALLRADLARQRAENESLIESTKGTDQEGLAALGVLKSTTDSAKAGQEAYKESILESVAAFDEYNKRVEESRQRTEERGEATEETTQADIDAGDAILAHKMRLEELAEAEAAAADAQEKIDEKITGAARDRERELIKIQLDGARKQIDDAIKAAEEREDIARKNADAIEDIYRQHTQDIADAATDLSRDEQDIARKGARQQIEVERDQAGERLNVEREYRRELLRIRDRFNQSAAEAERNNDAQAFLVAVRQRDLEVTDARRTRDDSLEDVKTRAAEQREELRLQLQYELEDARITNQRKLEDLQLRLSRELEEQRIKNERDIEEAALKEARLAEQRQREYARELADFATKEAQRIADLRRSLSEEIAAVQKAEETKRRIRVEEAQATVDQVRSIMSQLGLVSSGSSTGGQYYYRGAEQRQAGGEAEAGRPYIVGEKGPELFVPDRAGMVVPAAALGPGMAGVSNTYNNQRSVAPTFNVAQDLFANPVARRQLQNLILSVLMEAG